MRKVLVNLICLLLILTLAACSSKEKDSIVGKWESEMATYEFTSNGKLLAESDFDTRSGKYKADGENLTVTINGQTEDITYEVNGDILTLTSDQGESVELTKAD